MRTRGRIVGFVLLVVATAGTVVGATPERPDVKPSKPTGPQEVEVIAVMVDQRTQQPTVVLESKRDKRTLAMTIGLAEATGIAVPLQGITPPRPLTHDLFLTLFGRLKVVLTRVVITDLRDDIYYATLHLTTGGTQLTLDARPSDAIALAIRAKVPVLVEDRVFEKGGTSPAPARPQI